MIIRDVVLRMRSVVANVLAVFRYSDLYIAILLFMVPTVFSYVIIYTTFTNLSLVLYLAVNFQEKIECPFAASTVGGNLLRICCYRSAR